MAEPRKDDFAYVGRYVSPVLFQSSLFPTFDGDESKGLPPMNAGVFLDGYEYIRKEQWNAIADAAYYAVKEGNGVFFKNFFSAAKSGANRALAASVKVRAGGSLTPLLFREFLTEFHEMMYPWWASIPIGEGMEKAVLELTESRTLPLEAAATLFTPIPATPLMEHKRELERIRKKWEAAGHNDARVKADLQTHVEKFGWVGMLHLWGSPLTHEKALEEMKGLKAAGQPHAEAPLDGTLSRVKPFAGELCFWRQYCADACSMISFNVREKFDEASKASGFTYSEAIWLTGGEFLGMLEGKTGGLREKAIERSKAYGLVFDCGDSEIITGKRLSVLVDEFVEKRSKETSAKGMPANRGSATGTARIVWTPQDAGKVKKGDILVASETTPDFVPAIGRAAALVTDMGGITSHAAIISREYGIPCVVGTRNATRAFADGDIIEVDAVKGIVKLLKRGSG